jgi:hypothetical protein
MHVSEGRAINWPILNQTMFHPNLLSLCLLMCGVRHQLQLGGMIIT